MIFSSFNSTDDLSAYPPALQRALNYLKSTDFLHPEPGNYPIEGEMLFAKVFDQTSMPLDQARPEFHRNYIDIHYWPEGEDLAGYAPNPGTYPVTDSNEKDDLYFIGQVSDENFIHCGSGCFAIYFPWDIHRPSVAFQDRPITYRKVVVKVHMDLLSSSGR